MRTHTKGKPEMGRRFAIVIGVVAVGAMALGAAAAPAVVEYGTKLTITHERGTDRGALWHGGLKSGGGRKCMEGRRLVMFRERRGPDRELGNDLTKFQSNNHFWNWEVFAPEDGRVYAKVMPKVGDGFVCRADRSRTIVNGRGVK